MTQQKNSISKRITLSLATLGVAATTLIVGSAESAQAALIRFRLQDVTTSDNATISGFFDYNSNNPNLFQNFNIKSEAGLSVNTGGNYGSSSVSPGNIFPSLPSNTGNNVTVQSNPSSGPTHLLSLIFDQDITQLNTGDSATLIPGNVNFFSGPIRPSYEVFQINPSSPQVRAISGGTVVASNVPEPITILGTVVAGGIGVAMKKRKKTQES